MKQSVQFGLKRYLGWVAYGKPQALGILGLAFLTLLNGCGYTLNHRLRSSFESPKGIFIPVFDNVTSETGAEIVFTNALVRELESHGEHICRTRDEAGLDLVGTVSRVNQTVLNQTQPGNHRLQPFQRLPDQIGVEVIVNLSLIDRNTKAVLWSKEVTGARRVSAPLDRTADIDAPSSLSLITEATIESTYTEVARSMMQDAYDSMLESF